MTTGPLSRSRQSLLSGDRRRAAWLLRHTRWTNLCNALRALPARVRPSAYGLLDQQQLNQVNHQLTEPERLELRAIVDPIEPRTTDDPHTGDNPDHSPPAHRPDVGRRESVRVTV